MSTIRLIYIILHILEIWLLFIAGKKMSKTATNKEYWRKSLWAFIPYVFVLGLRFGHNIDWNYYCMTYARHQTMDWNTTEPLFDYFFYVFNSIGIPYFIVISLQVAFFMYSFLLLCKHFKNCLYYVLPLLPVVAQSNDNYIRWYWAVSFILIGFYWLLSNKGRKYLVSLTFFRAGSLVHNGSVILLLFIPAYFFLNKNFFSPKFSAIAIFISVFFISIAIMSFINDIATYLYLLGGNSIQDANISKYLLKVNDITSGGLSDVTGIKEYGMITKCIVYISFLPIVIYAPRFLAKYEYGALFYNLFIIGAFLNPFFSTVEIFDRYSKTLLIFQAVVTGITYYKLLRDKYKNGILRLFCMFSMLCCFYPFIRYSFLTKSDYRMMYIWDADGKEYIDTNLYILDMLKNR